MQKPIDPSFEVYSESRLLAPGEPSPVLTLGMNGRSNFVVTVDHAGHYIPRRLGSLGLPASQLQRHIAWDIGALEVARQVATALDAPLVAQNYSRLVIDCNRDPTVATSIVRQAESVEVPGNVGLSESECAARRVEIFEPYHACLHALLDKRLAAGQPTILVAQHSMTNVFQGVHREMHAAVLYNRDARFARLVLQRLRAEPALIIAENEPYAVSDATDYTVPHHAESRGLPYVEIEIRQDLLSAAAGVAEWAQRITRALREAERLFLKELP